MKHNAQRNSSQRLHFSNSISKTYSSKYFNLVEILNHDSFYCQQFFDKTLCLKLQLMYFILFTIFYVVKDIKGLGIVNHEAKCHCMPYKRVYLHIHHTNAIVYFKCQYNY